MFVCDGTRAVKSEHWVVSISLTTFDEWVFESLFAINHFLGVESAGWRLKFRLWASHCWYVNEDEKWSLFPEVLVQLIQSRKSFLETMQFLASDLQKSVKSKLNFVMVFRYQRLESLHGLAVQYYYYNHRVK